MKNRAGLSRAQDDLARQDSEREFRRNRDIARRELAEHYNEPPIWGYTGSAKLGKGARRGGRGWQE